MGSKNFLCFALLDEPDSVRKCVKVFQLSSSSAKKEL